MIVLQRRNKIKEMLLHERSVKVADLVKEFDISEETIRRDFFQLEQEGFVKREYGGAILSEDLQNTFTMPQPIQQRKFQNFSDIFEAEVKRAMISAGQKVVIVADHTKLQRQAMISFGSFQEVDILITSELADVKVIQEIENHGVQVIVCPMPSRQKK